MEDMVSVSTNPLASDLDFILNHTIDLWEEFRGRRIFITGGTGFFGCWLLEAFTWANESLHLDAEALVLTRNPEAFRRKAPHLAMHPSVCLHVGDVEHFPFPSGVFSHVIHASNEARAYANTGDCRLLTEGMIQAAKHVLHFAAFCGAKCLLYTSSGTVYGPQPFDMLHIAENYMGNRNKDDLRFAHGEGKYRSELLCREYSGRYGMKAKIARCFSFVGPYLPLDQNYAIGNFIRDGMQGKTISVHGDGTPVRSYLYASDLIIWLLTILVKGTPCEPYNVGSELEIDISTLAKTVARCFPTPRDVRIALNPTPGKHPERYVPSTEKGRTDLGLCQRVDLDEAIRKTLLWHEARYEREQE